MTIIESCRNDNHTMHSTYCSAFYQIYIMKIRKEDIKFKYDTSGQTVDLSI